MKVKFTTLTTYGLLGCVAGISYLLPDQLTVPTALASAPPDTVELIGLVRDFQKSHTDFNIGAPGEGYGHYAGNIQDWLPGDKRPVFQAGGYKVDAEWTDKDGRPIAGRLANVRPGSTGAATLGVRVNGKIKIESEGTIDSFDSRFGAYGVNGNYGNEALIATNSISSNAIEVKKKSTIFGKVLIGPGGDPGTVIRREGFISGSIAAQAEAYPIVPVSIP
jgi:hypothetical protein